MNEEISTFDTEDGFLQPNKIPTFLKVLCILSWVYVGFGLIEGISTSFTSKDEQMKKLDMDLEVTLNALSEQGDPLGWHDETIVFYNAEKENLMVKNILNLLLLLAEGLAVYFMFMQRRVGFWIYSGAQLGFILMILLLYPLSNYLTITSLFLLGFIIVLFEILYLVNLKHLKS